MMNMADVMKQASSDS